MRGAASLLVLGLLVSGCAGAPDDDPAGDGSSSTTSPQGEPANPKTETANGPVLPGAQWGRTNTTPVLRLTSGTWSVHAAQEGMHQIILSLAEDLDPRGYAIGGRFTLLLLPLDGALGPCQDSEVNFLATGIGGFSPTWSSNVDAGDYLAIIHAEEGADADFTWQVGSGEEEQELELTGESSGWKRTVLSPTINGADIAGEAPAGFHHLYVSGSGGVAMTSASIDLKVTSPAGACTEGADDLSTQLLGGTVSVVVQTVSEAPIAFTGHFEHSEVVAQDGSVRAAGVVLTPPA